MQKPDVIIEDIRQALTDWEDGEESLQGLTMRLEAAIDELEAYRGEG